jgi:hypothetical protein
VSFSMIEPEWEPICECKYDPVLDKMDREDCFFHCDMEEQGPPIEEPEVILKKPAAIVQQRKEDAA